MIFFPNCKINLGLDIIRKRQDGYHDIETVMVPVTGLCDILEIVPSRGKGVGFTSSGIAIDAPGDTNLCLKAYALMASRYDIGGVLMHLHKMIPSGAGLGGGSADAAFTIRGLNELFRLDLDDTQMESLAAGLGSDTAFFIRNVPQMARGRGEVLSDMELPVLKGKTLVIVKPGLSVSTAEAYAHASPKMPETPLAERVAGPVGGWKADLSNDFEKPVFIAHPLLAEIKNSLYGAGAIYASMSGSGSAIFSIFDTPPRDIASRLPVGPDEVFIHQDVI